MINAHLQPLKALMNVSYSAVALVTDIYTINDNNHNTYIHTIILCIAD